MLEKTRIKIASRFGKLEHNSGRLLGLLIAIDYFFIHKHHPFILAIFICWAVYLISHTLEKKFYPKNFRF